MKRQRPVECKPRLIAARTHAHFLPEKKERAKVTHTSVSVDEFFATINRIRESKTIRPPPELFAEPARASAPMAPRRTPATSAPRQGSVISAKSMETPA